MRKPDPMDLVDRIEKLPPRLRKMLIPLARGLTLKEIAFELGLSSQTVRGIYMTDIKQRMGMDTMTLRLIASRYMEALAS